jgi:putative acetyltransferase
MSGTEMSQTIRPEVPADYASIRRVNSLAFGQSEEADLVEGLRSNCPDLVSLVAESEAQIVGHILFSPAFIEVDSGRLDGMALGPMAVLPEFQRQGTGSKLVRAGLAHTTLTSSPFVIVLGHPEYYPRFGFVPASKYRVRSTWEVPDEVFMILVRNEAALRGYGGTARYRPEFDLLT